MALRGSGSRMGEVTYEVLIKYTLIRMAHQRIHKNPQTGILKSQSGLSTRPNIPQTKVEFPPAGPGCDFLEVEPLKGLVLKDF